MLSWKKDLESSIPLYVQLSNHIHNNIILGKFPEGYKLPSQRIMAKKLGVGRNTIIRALEMLAKDELIVINSRAVALINKTTPQAACAWSEYFSRANLRPAMKEFWWDKGDRRDLVSLSDEFNVAKYYGEAIKACSKRSKDLHSTDPYGLPALRESVIQHMKSCGVETSADNVIICPSLDQTIYTACASLLSQGMTLIHEPATLLNVITNTHSLGANMQAVPQDDYGIIPSKLEQLLNVRKHAILFTDPIAHAPTGITTTENRQRELMRVIQKHRMPVIENGHKRDTWCDEPFPPPMKAIDKNDNVIYMGAFQKSAVRMNMTWVIADKTFVRHLSSMLEQSTTLPSSIMQIIADEMFRSGKYYQLMEDMRQFIRARRNMGLELCDKYLKDIAQWEAARCGFHFWIKLNSKINKNILYGAQNFSPGYFFDKSDTCHILFAPASLPEAALEKTVKSIAKLVQK
ncbi:MAG: PLP-dependent aminotransferase family protein [Deferribacteraceae bacterium]|jgi:GntR family transcriptional regulator of abcA and norABC|nr:PLP-dependent aminotransferase family protein [Deferribacteraceae bacterium]